MVGGEAERLRIARELGANVVSSSSSTSFPAALR